MVPELHREVLVQCKAFLERRLYLGTILVYYGEHTWQ